MGRLTHRRVGARPNDASNESKIKQLEEQLELDRDVIGKVRDFVIEINNKVNKLDKANEATTKNTLNMEKAIMEKIEANKQIGVNDVNAKVSDLKERFKFELSNEECFTAHLIGKDPDKKPVLRPLIDLYMKDKLEGIEQKFIILNSFMQERVKRDGAVNEYLERIEREKPEDGNFIKAAFMGVATELIEIRAATMEANVSAVHNGTPPGLQGQSKPDHSTVDQQEFSKLRDGFGKLQVDMAAMAQQIQGKCHCVHVDQVGNKLIVMDRQLDVHTKAISIMEKSIEMMRTLQTAPQSQSAGTDVPPPPAPTGTRPPRKRAPQWANWKPTCSDDKCKDEGCQDHDEDDDGSGDSPWYLAEKMGGNGYCHCVHLEELRREVDLIKQQLEDAQDATFDPWSTGSSYSGAVGRRTRTKPQALPIKIGPLGQLQDANARLFDDRISAQAAFQFDGIKGGSAWKSKVERYFMSKCPALLELLSWAERYEGEKIDEPLLSKATAGTDLDQPRMANLNASVWGFISGCISGEAETIFKIADALQGFDAWRRIVNYIEHGKPIKLEGMRNDMKMMFTKPMKNLEAVPIGIAEFELQIKEYVDCGGPAPSDEEKKSDLLRILPETLQDNLLWRATDPGPYAQFRDMIKAQAARTLLNKRRLPVHAVAQGQEPKPEANGDIDLGSVTNMEELLAVMKRFGARKPGNEPDKRGARKCPNCGEEHKDNKCPHPPVAVADRKCWTCGKKGHSNRDCPERKKGKPIKSVEDEVEEGVRLLGSLREGFSQPKKVGKPMPRAITMKDFTHVNRFNALNTVNTELSQKQRKAMARRVLPDKSTKPLSDSNVAQKRAPMDNCVQGAMGVPADEAPAETQRDSNATMLKAVDQALDNMARIGMLDFGDDAYIYEREILRADIPDETTVEVAADTGAVANVINKNDLPKGVVPDGVVKTHFVGASDEHIENYGTCRTLLKGNIEDVVTEWQAADVSKALHSISATTGPEDGPGNHDVLFNNKIGVVVPPGVVNKILERIKPIFQYKRSGGLYTAKVKLSSFTRPCQQK